MADAYGKLTGRPGIAVVTRGPGATHASVGVHTAFQDSTPMILLIGQVASDQVEREAFQEVDFRHMFGPMTKWVAQIDRADRIPEYVSRAFATACAGRPGPVVLALPEDMLAGETDASDAKPFHVVQPYPGCGADRRAADQARASRTATRDHRRWRLVARCGTRHAHVSRGKCAAGRRRVPPPGRDRQRLAELCRRRRHRHQPEARRAGARVRSPARRRPAPRRDDDVGLHARRAADACADTRPRAPRCGGARPRLPRRLADPLRNGELRGRGARPARRAGLAGLGGGGARRLRGMADTRPDARNAGPRRVHRPAARARAGRDRHERRRQLLGVGSPLLALARVPDAARADERRDGLRPLGCESQRRSCTPSGP